MPSSIQHIFTFIQRIPIALKYLAGIGLPLTAIFTLVKDARNFVVKSWRWIGGKVALEENPHRLELKIVPDRTGHCQWHEGRTFQGRLCMHVYCKLFITNVGPSPIPQILDVSIRKPKTQGTFEPFKGNIRQVVEPASGARLALPFEARFTVEPPVVRSGQTFIADVVLVDQFAEEHVAKKVEFKARAGSGWLALK